MSFDDVVSLLHTSSLLVWKELKKENLRGAEGLKIVLL